MRFRASFRSSLLLLVATSPLVAHAQFPALSKEELNMTSDPKAPGAAAVYLSREETVDDPHSFRTVYARIKVLTEAGKSAAIVHIDLPQTFVFSATGNNSSRMTGGTGSTSSQTTIGPANSAHWDMPSLAHIGEDQPWDTESYVG